MYPNLKAYIESKRGISPNKSIADYVLDNKVLKDLDFAFIDTLYQENKNAKPFTGMRVLFNMHQDRATWLLMFYYEALGAQVEASNFNLSELPFAADAFKHANISYYKNQLPNKTRDYYHHIVDCGAGALASFDPKYGMAELTQTLPHLYTDISFPVVSVNETAAKEAETNKGTGEGGLSALPSAIVQLITDSVGRANTALSEDDKMAIYHYRFKANFYVIIGGDGKVARGFVRALLQKGVQANHILLVDTKKTNPQSDDFGNEVTVPFLENEQGELVGLSDKPAFKQAILAHMQKTEPSKNYTIENFAAKIALVTATGVANLLSDNNYFPSDFGPHTWFINMGQPDEYGPNFPEDCMTGGTKGALNFNRRWLEKNGFATETKYLMPCWGALALSSMYAIQHQMNRGIWPTPLEIDRKMVNLAIEIYGHEFDLMARFIQQRVRRTDLSSPSYSLQTSSSTDAKNDSSPPSSPDRSSNGAKKRSAKTAEEQSTLVAKVIKFTQPPLVDSQQRRYNLRCNK
jgi:hypothetical protein